MADDKSKILVVEADLDVAEMLDAYFRVQQYEVVTANNGEKGIRACQKSNPNLIILDTHLPDVDGYEVARRLRIERKTQDTPIIFLADKRDHGARLRGLELGADDYITKPFDVQELRLRVRNALRRATQGSLNNPVSGLPDGALVDEKFKAFLEIGKGTLLVVSLRHLNVFRDLYGFVASDDVLRAVSLMLQGALRETGQPGDFVGHLTPTDFVMLVSGENLAAVKERVQARLEQSLDFFYPLRDREQLSGHADRLAVTVLELPAAEGLPDTLEDLRKKMLDLIREEGG